jgi:hypothetical protein
MRNIFINVRDLIDESDYLCTHDSWSVRHNHGRGYLSGVIIETATTWNISINIRDVILDLTHPRRYYSCYMRHNHGRSYPSVVIVEAVLRWEYFH